MPFLTNTETLVPGLLGLGILRRATILQNCSVEKRDNLGSYWPGWILIEPAIMWLVDVGHSDDPLRCHPSYHLYPFMNDQHGSIPHTSW